MTDALYFAGLTSRPSAGQLTDANMADDWTRYGPGETIRCPCPPPKDRQRSGLQVERRARLRVACDHGLGVVDVGYVEVRVTKPGTKVGTRRRCPRCGGERQERSVPATQTGSAA